MHGYYTTGRAKAETWPGRQVSDLHAAAMLCCFEGNRQAAKAQGQGFLGQWGAQMGVNLAICERYCHTPVEVILSGHPENFWISIHQVRRVEVQQDDSDEHSQPDQLVIHAAEKMQLALRGTNVAGAERALRQVLGKVMG